MTVLQEKSSSYLFGSILAHTEEGKKELLFLSNRNPGLLERLCAYL